MKKVFIFLFLLMPNMIILVHAGIPHHHHEEVACFNSHVCDQLGETHKHSEPCQSSQDQCLESCTIDQVYTRSNYFDEINDHNTHDLILLSGIVLLFDLSSSVNEFIVFPSYEKPYLQSFHSVFITKSLGLRAPPAFI